MRVYVGTYAKYNSGNLFGRWLDIEDYADEDDFHATCAELHKDEEDPEFMFQDWEYIPAGMVSESHIDSDLFDLALEDEDTIEMFRIYRDNVDLAGTLQQAKDEFRGKYDSRADYAQEYWEELGCLKDVPEQLQYHIDWESVAEEMRHSGVTFVREGGDVWVFVD